MKAPSGTTATSIEIGISALNEEANIANLLGSIAGQIQDTFVIERITLISDGSSDQTVTKAKALNISNLRIIDHAKPAGKSTRMAELIENCQQDIIILFDADVVLASPHTVSALVKPLIAGEATLVSGRPVKTKTPAFTDRVMDVSAYLQDEVKRRLNHGDSIYACHGRVVGLHRAMFGKLKSPYSAVGNDAFLYFFNKQNGHGFIYVDNATVRFKMPQTLKDFVKQQRRFSSTPQEQQKRFGNGVAKAYKIPPKLSVKIFASALAKFHIYAMSYVVYRIIAQFSPSTKQARWSVSESTKGL